MPTKKPLKKPASRYHHGDLRSALVTMAWSVIDRRGIEGFSLRAVADALGVSHAAPTHHFRDKEQLLDELRVQAWGSFADALERGGHTQTPLRSMGLAYVAFALAHPKRLQLMFRASERGPTAQVKEQSMRAWSALVGAVAQHVGPRRAANERSLQSLAVAAWAQVHGLAMLWTEVTLPDEMPKGSAATPLHAYAIDVLLAGIGGHEGTD